MGADDLEYTVQEGDTFQSIASRHGIDDWEDLWQHNREAFPEPRLKAGDAQGGAVRIVIPRPALDLGRQKLLERLGAAEEVERLLGGTSWLDPRGLFCHSIVDEKGQPLDGVPVIIRDPELGRVHVEQARQGLVRKRLPRKDFEVEVRAFPGWARSFGFFSRNKSRGDVAGQALGKGREPATGEAPSPRTRPMLQPLRGLAVRPPARKQPGRVSETVRMVGAPRRVQ